MKITRRIFFNKTLKGAAVLTIPSLLTAVLESCGSNNASNPVSTNFSNLQISQVAPQNNIISLTIDSSSPLSAEGGALLLEFSGGNILVDRPDQNSFNALSAVCTHQGCLITDYNSSNKQFICPCHGSRFNFDGQVTNGPATRPLPKYQTQFSDNKLSITV